jgi:pimeloyl-ACP methyl ester carboxylesterase
MAPRLPRRGTRPQRVGDLGGKVNEFDRNFTGWQPYQLAAVSAPVMLIAGDADIVTADHVVEMFKLLGGGKPGDLGAMPDAQLAILPGTNHVDVLDRVDWLHSMIMDFLTPLDA